MATQHSNLLSIFLLFVATFFYLHPTATAIREVTTTGAPGPAPAPFAARNSGDTNAVAFIRSICGGTHFPDACFSSLSRYANAVNEDLAELTRIALSLSVTKARGMASHMTTGGGDASTLRDCSAILGEIMDNIQSSVKLVRRTNSVGNRADLLSNTQTLMRSALANVDSCATEMEGAKDGAIEIKFQIQVKELKELISNALDIVNSYAQKIS